MDEKNGLLEEYDENGNLLNTYTDTLDYSNSNKTIQIISKPLEYKYAYSDLPLPLNKNPNLNSDLKISGNSGNSGNSLTHSTPLSTSDASSWFQLFIQIFLPSGYPYSVSDDYVDYQIYDSIQAFSSSIASLLANRAVLAAVGVGDSNATSTSALFMKIIQETVGRLATIAFAWKFGFALEPECKKYRFAADLANDSAIIFDTLSPHFPDNIKIPLLCCSGMLRAICGVMAGGSRAALTQHFTHPKKGSIADVNAKDASQETVISLMGMILGSVVVTVVNSPTSTWICMFFLLSIHLATNYAAVKSVVMTTLNKQRTNLLFEPLIDYIDANNSNDVTDIYPIIPTPQLIAKKESILPIDGALYWNNQKIGYASYVPFSKLYHLLPHSFSLSHLFSIFTPSDKSSPSYLLWYTIDKNTSFPLIYISLISSSSSSSSSLSKSNSTSNLKSNIVSEAIADHISNAIRNSSNIGSSTTDFSPEEKINLAREISSSLKIQSELDDTSQQHVKEAMQDVQAWVHALIIARHLSFNKLLLNVSDLPTNVHGSPPRRKDSNAFSENDRKISNENEHSLSKIEETIKLTFRYTDNIFRNYNIIDSLQRAGWDLERSYMQSSVISKCKLSKSF